MTRRIIIFDLDGTLIDSNAVKIVAFNAAKCSCGTSIRGSVNEFMSHSGLPLLEVCRRMDLPEDFAMTYLAESRRLRSKISTFPNVVELINEIHAASIMMAILTGRDRESTVSILNMLNLGRAFTIVVTSDDKQASKPSPKSALWICHVLGVKPEECVMVGDSTVDMECGVRAGMLSIGCTWGVCTEAELVDAGASKVVGDVHGLRTLLLRES